MKTRKRRKPDQRIENSKAGCNEIDGFDMYTTKRYN
jgi:hypothetical protein